MLWWWKLQFNSPDGATRQRAIEKFTCLLADSSEARQQKAAELLATIGHPLAVRWALEGLTDRDCAESRVRMLEQMVTEFSREIETGILERIAELDDPLQKISTPPASIGGRHQLANWENYRAINCSTLRQKAEAELVRRWEAEAQWLAADEERTRQAAPVPKTDRRSA
jgi:hypothetical protein